MKNKSLRYILIFSVIFVWGTIAYKIFTYVNSDDSEIQSQNTIQQKNEQSSATDTFHLVANYRDPFLGRTTLTNVQNANPNSQKIIKTEKQKEVPKIENKVISWPKLTYLGIIVNQKSKNQTGLLKVNGKDFIIHQGNIVAEMEIVKLYNDSVTVKYSEDIKTIVKNK